AHVPGLVDSVELPAHVHDTAIVICTSGCPSTGHFPGCCCATRPGCCEHVQIDTRRIGCSVMPQRRHLPGLSSMTSSSPGIGQTYDNGGRLSFLAGAAVFWSAKASAERKVAAERSVASASIRMRTRDRMGSFYVIPPLCVDSRCLDS